MSENINSVIFKKINILNRLKKKFENNIKLTHIFKDYSNNINIILVTKNDKVFCFGHNSKGLLGFGDQYEIKEEKINEDLSDKQIIEFKNSSFHAIARTFDGKLLCWGYNDSGSLGNGKDDKLIYKPTLNEYLLQENIIAICCGSEHTIVLTSNAEVYAWGYNNKGQVGNRSNKECVLKPVKVIDLCRLKVKNISCGFWHSMALTDEGCILGWGHNVCKQLGIVNGHYNSPNLIKLGRNIIIKRISCGLNHSLLLSNDGYIYVFGYKYNEKLNINSNCRKDTMPLMLSDSNEFKKIATHYNRNISYALSEDGWHYAWGYCGDYKRIRVTCELEDFHMHNFEKIFDEFLISGEPLIYQDKIVDNYIPYGKYVKFWYEKEKLGEGSYGEVWEVESKEVPNDPIPYAMKKVIIDADKKYMKDIDSIKELLNAPLIKNLNSEFLVKYYDVWYENDFKIIDRREYSENYIIYIQMDLCDKKLIEVIEEINSYFRSNQENDLTSMDYYISSKIFIELLKGVEYLHNKDIIHRDLNPNNILLKNGTIKIADFGLAKVNDQIRGNTLDRGTIKYMAPEVDKDKKYNYKADIYSLGIIVMELFNMNFNEFIQYNDEVTKLKHEKLKYLIIGMTCVMPSMRPDCEKILEERKNWTLNESEFNFNEELEILQTNSFEIGFGTYIQSIISSELEN